MRYFKSKTAAADSIALDNKACEQVLLMQC